MSEELLVEITDHVAVATFNRPSARNAMTWSMYSALVDFCERVDDDPRVRVAVLRGAGGKAFVAGTDIAQFQAFQQAQDGIDYERRIDSVLSRLESVQVPTIAAIDGYATGGGMILAGACDMRVCTPAARFGLPIARTVGNCLSMASYARLIQLIGSTRTSRLIYTAEFIEADEALRIGLASELVDESGYEQRLSALCERIAQHAPLTMRASKTALRRLREHELPPDEDLIAMCYGSHDFQEGVRAFTAKRAPQWTAT